MLDRRGRESCGGCRQNAGWACGGVVTRRAQAGWIARNRGGWGTSSTVRMSRWRRVKRSPPCELQPLTATRLAASVGVAGELAHRECVARPEAHPRPPPDLRPQGRPDPLPRAASHSSRCCSPAVIETRARDTWPNLRRELERIHLGYFREAPVRVRGRSREASPLQLARRKNSVHPAVATRTRRCRHWRYGTRPICTCTTCAQAGFGGCCPLLGRGAVLSPNRAVRLAPPGFGGAESSG